MAAGSLVAYPEHVISDTDRPLKDEIHLLHLVLFVIYDAILISGLKLPRHEPEGDIVQESGIRVQIYLLADARVVGAQVEHPAIPEKHILEQVHVHDLILDALGESREIAIVNSDGGEAVVCPVVAEVALDLRDQGLWQRLVIRVFR